MEQIGTPSSGKLTSEQKIEFYKRLVEEIKCDDYTGPLRRFKMNEKHCAGKSIANELICRDEPMSHYAPENLRRQFLKQGGAVEASHFDDHGGKPKHYCFNCAKQSTYRCARCHSAHYCSKKCQIEEWSFHKQYCNTKNKI